MGDFETYKRPEPWAQHWALGPNVEPKNRPGPDSGPRAQAGPLVYKKKIELNFFINLHFARLRSEICFNKHSL